MNQPALPKDENKPCLERFNSHMDVIKAAMENMVKGLNTMPLVLLPVKIREKGNGFIIAISLGNDKYCPIGRVLSSATLKEMIETVEIEGAYTLSSQAEIPGFKEFNAGELWS